MRILLMALVAPLVVAGCGDDPAVPPAAMQGGPPIPSGFDVSFNVYSGASFTDLLGSVSLNSSLFRTTANYDAHEPNMTPGCTWRYQSMAFIDEDVTMDPEHPEYRHSVYIDIAVSYTPDRRTPTFVKIIQPPRGSHGYKYDMRINGKIVVHNLDRHQGLVFDLQRGAAATNTGAK